MPKTYINIANIILLKKQVECNILLINNFFTYEHEFLVKILHKPDMPAVTGIQIKNQPLAKLAKHSRFAQGFFMY